MEKTVYLVSLGCSKNLVDSEIMIGNLQTGGWNLVEDPLQAKVLLINTCGFIQSAVEEAIDEILQLEKIKLDFPGKKLVVVGCLVQRYGEKLLAELPDVDLFLGTEVYSQITNHFDTLFRRKNLSRIAISTHSGPVNHAQRVLTTPHFRSFLKIAEGCNNRCTYCMIPAIRGSLKSRTISDIVNEAKILEGKGVKELSLIAQDLTAFGNDLVENVNIRLLLKKLLEHTSIPWLRLMYLYPSGIDDRLLGLIADEPRILPYLDIPIQHASSRILSAMNRRYSLDNLYTLIQSIRFHIPDIALRTTLLVGFPGETEEDIRQLEQFLREAKFDHAGVFSYSNEEGCASEYFPSQCSDEEKEERRRHLLEVQADVSAHIQAKYIGKTEAVLIEGISSESDLLLEGRTRFQAPDVDGCVYIIDGTASPGDIVDVYITEAHVYDLVGKIIENGYCQI